MTQYKVNRTEKTPCLYRHARYREGDDLQEMLRFLNGLDQTDSEQVRQRLQTAARSNLTAFENDFTNVFRMIVKAEEQRQKEKKEVIPAD